MAGIDWCWIGADVRFYANFEQNMELCVEFLREKAANLPFLCKMWSYVWISFLSATHNSIFCSLLPIFLTFPSTPPVPSLLSRYHTENPNLAWWIFSVRLPPQLRHKKTGLNPVFYVWWRWWESNPRPKAFPQNFLRAQLIIYCFASVHAGQQAGTSAILLFL